MHVHVHMKTHTRKGGKKEGQRKRLLFFSLGYTIPNTLSIVTTNVI